jgi:hypothetical protein
VSVDNFTLFQIFSKNQMLNSNAMENINEADVNFMINYGEEIAYWYLRFNGFFPIDNFVIHQSRSVDHHSDVDIIAIRLPYVYEEIGGQTNDWDTHFFKPFDPNLPIGVICEVKTGQRHFNVNDLFKPQNISYAVGRFGFIDTSTDDYAKLVSSVNQEKLATFRNQFQIAKVLFSTRVPKDDNRFFHFPLLHLQNFIQDRIRKYDEKYRDRLLFPSNLIQYLTDFE